MRAVWIFVALALPILLHGCFYYSTSSSLLAHIKTVAVPRLENRKPEYGITDQLTDGIIEALVEDGTLKVVDESNADSVIRGTIIDVQDSPFTYTASEEAVQYRVSLFVELSYYDVKKKKIIWQEKALEGWGVYEASSGASFEERQKGIDSAINMLMDEIVDRTVAGW